MTPIRYTSPEEEAKIALKKSTNTTLDLMHTHKYVLNSNLLRIFTFINLSFFGGTYGIYYFSGIPDTL